ncbi:gastrula zinc finger protein XlCGF8.2DB-like [Cheilinus undulatus]|uniref:gastrula zinc finger protein XlCGF8.2DB-like n=1 Tax=Cheilinus undulatus TaxID=241271 RepID=UPI001BD23E06|nr:gastrula zinc finger protein XlCGF8.2DB-like [Cheilinus undulatus]
MSEVQGLSVLPTDVRHVSVGEEQQVWSSCLDQEETKPPHIKEEQEELWIGQDEEKLQDQENIDIQFPFSYISVKTEDDEEKPQSIQQHEIKAEQMETGADREDYEGSEQARSSDPKRHLHPVIEVKIEDSSEPEAVGSNNVKCTVMYQSGLSSVERLRDQGQKTNEKLNSCSDCGKIFKKKRNLMTHMIIHTKDTILDCSKCDERFNLKAHLEQHMRIHVVAKPISCPECDKRFRHKGHLTDHLRTHTGEKPFSCSECGKRFSRKENLTQHMFIHTREKPFDCSECGKKFNLKGHLRQHMRIHMLEKPFCCSECGKAFTCKENLTQHMHVHMGEKPFNCSMW